jgi:hypothetical protein
VGDADVPDVNRGLPPLVEFVDDLALVSGGHGVGLLGLGVGVEVAAFRVVGEVVRVCL